MMAFYVRHADLQAAGPLSARDLEKAAARAYPLLRLSRGHRALSSHRGERAPAGSPLAGGRLAHRVRAEATAERAWRVFPRGDCGEGRERVALPWPPPRPGQGPVADRRLRGAPGGMRGG